MGLIIARYMILIGILVTIVVAFFRIRYVYLKQKNIRIKQQYEILDTYYATLKEQSEQIGLYRKEIADTLSELENVTEYHAGEIEELSPVTPEYTTQRILESVFKHKIRECDEKCIPVVCKISNGTQSHAILDKELPLSDIDLVGVFYNLFDNMIEANEAIADMTRRWIRINCQQSEHEITFHFENAKLKGKVLTAGKKTRKQNQNEHGIGLSIIRNLVKKYDGSIQWTEGEDVFVVDMSLPTK